MGVDLSKGHGPISVSEESLWLLVWEYHGGTGLKHGGQGRGSCNNSGGKGRDFDNTLRVVSVGRHKFKMTQ